MCRANVSCSPMAEALFNALADERRLPWQAESAGVAALVWEDITPKARAALEEAGVYAGWHAARQVDGRMLGRAELVLAMGPRQVAALRRRFGGRSGKVHALPAYAWGPGRGWDRRPLRADHDRFSGVPARDPGARRGTSRAGEVPR